METLYQSGIQLLPPKPVAAQVSSTLLRTAQTCHYSYMRAINILDLLRLRSAPWLSLILSVVAWFALWAIFHDVTVTSTVGNFLLALGLPSSVDSGAMSVHNWLIAAPRVTWLSWGTIILALAVGVRYVRAVYNQRESLNELMGAGRQVSQAKSRPVNEGRFPKTKEMHAQEVEYANAKRSKAAKYDREVRSFEQASQLRCAAMYWLIAAIFVELKSKALPDLTVVGTATKLTTVLIVI